MRCLCACTDDGSKSIQAKRSRHLWSCVLAQVALDHKDDPKGFKNYLMTTDGRMVMSMAGLDPDLAYHIDPSKIDFDVLRGIHGKARAAPPKGKSEPSKGRKLPQVAAIPAVA